MNPFNQYNNSFNQPNLQNSLLGSGLLGAAQGWVSQQAIPMEEWSRMLEEKAKSGATPTKAETPNEPPMNPVLLLTGDDL